MASSSFLHGAQQQEVVGSTMRVQATAAGLGQYLSPSTSTGSHPASPSIRTFFCHNSSAAWGGESRRPVSGSLQSSPTTFSNVGHYGIVLYLHDLREALLTEVEEKAPPLKPVLWTSRAPRMAEVTAHISAMGLDALITAPVHHAFSLRPINTLGIP